MRAIKTVNLMVKTVEDEQKVVSAVFHNHKYYFDKFSSFLKWDLVTAYDIEISDKLVKKVDRVLNLKI